MLCRRTTSLTKIQRIERGTDFWRLHKTGKTTESQFGSGKTGPMEKIFQENWLRSTNMTEIKGGGNEKIPSRTLRKPWGWAGKGGKGQKGTPKARKRLRVDHNTADKERTKGGPAREGGSARKCKRLRSAGGGGLRKSGCKSLPPWDIVRKEKGDHGVKERILLNLTHGKKKEDLPHGGVCSVPGGVSPQRTRRKGGRIRREIANWREKFAGRSPFAKDARDRRSWMELQEGSEREKEELQS